MELELQVRKDVQELRDHKDNLEELVLLDCEDKVVPLEALVLQVHKVLLVGRDHWVHEVLLDPQVHKVKLVTLVYLDGQVLLGLLVLKVPKDKLAIREVQVQLVQEDLQV